MRPSAAPFLRTWLIWTAGFLAFPLAGLAGTAMPVLWALGWTATTLGGIDVAQQFTVFGAYGALTFSALSGVLLHRLLPYRDAKRPAHTPVEATR